VSRHFIFLGPPGAGKGTLSAGVTEALGIIQISTGELLRAAIAAETPLGQEASTFMDGGRLVPDSLVLGLVEDRLEADDCQSGFILDGFPRTIPQAEALEADGVTIDCVVNFVLTDETIIERLSGRRLHAVTGKTYNVNPGGFPQPPVGTRDADLIQRDDDRPESIAQRLEVYRKQTAPLMAFYRARGILLDIDVDRTVGEIHQELMARITPSAD
jgi:adenylate kinase